MHCAISCPSDTWDARDTRHGERRAVTATTAPPDGNEVGATKKTVAGEPLVRVIEGGNHTLSGESHKLFVKEVESFVSGLMDTVEC